MNSNLFRRGVLCTLLCGTMSSTSASEMLFQEAWTVLQQKNNSIAAQRANVERYRQHQEAQNALNLPSVTLGANYTILEDDVTLSGEQLLDSLDSNSRAALGSAGAANATLGALLNTAGHAVSTLSEREILNSSIRAVWPIYTGGRITAAQHIAAGQTDQAVAELAMESITRYQDLARYYFSVVLARDVLNTRINVERGLEKHRDFAIKLQEQGQIAKVERLQAEASLEHAIVKRKSAEKDLQIAVAALTQILNQDEVVSPTTELFVNHSLPPLSAFTEQTLNCYPGLSLLQAKEKQASNLIKAEQGNYHPEVYLYGNYTVYEEESLTSELLPDWMVGIGVSLPLIDNSGRSENVKSAKSALLQVNHLTAQARQDLTVLVQRSYSEAEKAIEEVTGLDSSMALAEENLKLRSKAFNQGLSTSLDVVDAELYLASIQTQQAVARYNYLIALNQLLALSGNMDTFNQYQLSAYQSNSEES